MSTAVVLIAVRHDQIIMN